MKKIIALIMIAISIITLGYYNISTILSNKVNMDFEEVSGDRNVLKEDKIKLSTTKNGLTTYEQTISKEGSNIEKSYVETMDFNISKEEFEKNKSFYRGFHYLELPVYEDEQHKILAGSTSNHDYSSDDVTNEVNISYIDKSKGDTVNRIKLIAPVKVYGVNPMAMKKINGKLTYIYYGQLFNNEHKSVIVVTTIDLKAGTMKKEKVIDLEKVFGTKNFNVRGMFSTEQKLYMSYNNYDNEGGSKETVYGMDLKSYDIKKTNMNIDDIGFKPMDEINGNLFFTKTENGKFIINKFNKETESIVAHKEVPIPQEYLETSENGASDEMRGNAYVNLIGMKDNKIYLSIQILDASRKSYMEVLDANSGSSLYKCRVSNYIRNVVVE